jgi:hypothetical protein
MTPFFENIDEVYFNTIKITLCPKTQEHAGSASEKDKALEDLPSQQATSRD